MKLFKYIYIAVTLLMITMTFIFCKNDVESQVMDLAQYHRPKMTGIQSGGIQMIPIHTPNGDFKVWTKTVGNNPKIKVLLLHGGPAGTHEYWECAASFFPQEGIEFILYDQLGSHYSDQPTDSALWTTARFVEEVEQVRLALGRREVSLFGVVPELLHRHVGNLLGCLQVLGLKSRLVKRTQP